MLDALSPELFDLLIIIVIVVGVILAGVRLYDDFTRPLPPSSRPNASQETRPARPVSKDD